MRGSVEDATELALDRHSGGIGSKWTLSGYFMPKSVFVPAVLDQEGSNFKDNFAKTNKHRPTALAGKCRPISAVLAV